VHLHHITTSAHPLSHFSMLHNIKHAMMRRSQPTPPLRSERELHELVDRLTRTPEEVLRATYGMHHPCERPISTNVALVDAQGGDKTALVRDIVFRELQAQTQKNLARILDKRPSKKGKSTHELPEVMMKVDKLLLLSTPCASSTREAEQSETNPMEIADGNCLILDGLSECHAPSDQSVQVPVPDAWPAVVELETGELFPSLLHLVSANTLGQERSVSGSGTRCCSSWSGVMNP